MHRQSGPTAENGTVGRKFLTPDEVAHLIELAKKNRWGQRDALMIRMAYEHGLRSQELVDLRWGDILLNSQRIFVRRRKGGLENMHPLTGEALRGLRRQREKHKDSDFVFITERGEPFTTSGFRKMLGRLGPYHPHQLRHARGYKLANQGQDTRAIQEYLGHKDIRSTAIYTALNAKRFRGFSD